MEGDGADAAPAEAVAAEIAAAGGAAVADASDIATAAGARAVVDAAVTNFGRIDILINNAGIIQWAGFPEVDEDNLARHLAVHTVVSFNTARAAWPHMTGAGYGRIVLTTSSGIFGLPDNTSYATAKAAVIGLGRNLAVAGRKHGIRANLVAPAAMTRMAGGGDDGAAGPMAPGLVAPLVAYLAHEECPVTGEIYAAGAGRFARIFIATVAGYVNRDPDVTMEDVADNWAAINDDARYSVPGDLRAWSATFLDHLPPGGS
jgi:NAD(P)-dependent dehydrogenase (short-subunit alcohol dehydrogenase family)